MLFLEVFGIQSIFRIEKLMRFMIIKVYFTAVQRGRKKALEMTLLISIFKEGGKSPPFKKNRALNLVS